MRAFIVSLFLLIFSVTHVHAQQTPSIDEVQQWADEAGDHLEDGNLGKARPVLWKMSHADYSAIDDEEYVQLVQDFANGWLGWMYLSGDGVSQNFDRAEKFLLKANGNGESYRQLAWLYREVRNDPKKAAEYQELYDAKDN